MWPLLQRNLLLSRHQALDDATQESRAAGILHMIAHPAVERGGAKVAAHPWRPAGLVGGVQDLGLGHGDLAAGTGRREAVRPALEVDDRDGAGRVDGAIDQGRCLRIDELDLNKVESSHQMKGRHFMMV